MNNSAKVRRKKLLKEEKIKSRVKLNDRLCLGMVVVYNVIILLLNRIIICICNAEDL